MLRAGLGQEARRACSASISAVGGVLTGTAALAGPGKPSGLVSGGHPVGALDGAQRGGGTAPGGRQWPGGCGWRGSRRAGSGRPLDVTDMSLVLARGPVAGGDGVGGATAFAGFGQTALDAGTSSRGRSGGSPPSCDRWPCPARLPMAGLTDVVSREPRPRNCCRRSGVMSRRPAVMQARLPRRIWSPSRSRDGRPGGRPRRRSRPAARWPGLAGHDGAAGPV